MSIVIELSNESNEKSVVSSFIEKTLLAPIIKIMTANKRAITNVLITTLTETSPLMISSNLTIKRALEKHMFSQIYDKDCKKDKILYIYTV